MEKQKMKRIFFFCTFVLFALTACQTVTKREFGQYKGQIESITSPIVLQYGPFPESTMVDSTEMYLIADDHKELIDSSVERSTISSHRRGSNIIMNVKITEPEMTIKLICTDYGVIKDLEMGTLDFNLSASENKIIKETITNFIKSIVVEYPEKGVIDGDKINMSCDFASLFRSIDPDIDNITVSSSVTVTGTTQHNNRQAIIMDSFINLKISSVELQFSGSGYGYYLVDIATGVPIYSEYLVDFHIPIEGDTITFQMVDTMELDLK
jgi:hypothetical protein